MDTLRGFVDAVWTTDDSAHHPHAPASVWSKPDTISRSFELRRLTTSKNAAGVRTDFFEFYWAHMMTGTSVRHVLAWARVLLLRSPATVPRPLLVIWAFLLALGLVVVFLAVQTVVPEAWRLVTVPRWVTGGLGAAFAWLSGPIVERIIGDAARYLNPAPTNVGRRQQIRAKGVELIERLHDAGYERIIVVGHSLGSVIGYDVLTHAWALHNSSVEPRAHPLLDALEAEVAAGPVEVDAYQRDQRRALDELQDHGLTWRVTDFVTLGSPLTYADILLASDAGQLAERQADREYPTCPPVLEDGHFSYPPDQVGRKPHHAAVFGLTRWTNLFFPARLLVFGDLVGGPLRPVFGTGVDDVRVTTRQRLGLLTHTLYWSIPDGSVTAPHLTALRRAVRLVEGELG